MKPALVLVIAMVASGMPFVAFGGPNPPASSPNGAIQNYKPDLATGRAPTLQEVADAEREAAAHPQDFSVVRKLGKTYFYRFFGAHDKAAAPEAHATLERALSLKPDD